MTKKKLIDHSFALLTVLIWGVTFVSTKHLEQTISSLDILFIRYLIAYVTLWVVCPKPLLYQGWKKEGYMFLVAMTGAALYQYLENLSVFYTSPSSVSFITSTAPIFTALLAHRFLKEKLNAKILIGMAISVIGVFLICFGDSKSIETGLKGDLIISVSVWLWAVYSVLIKRVYSFGYSQFHITRRLFMYSVLVMIPFMLLKKDRPSVEELIQPDVLWNLLFLGILASALCFVTWNRSVDKLGATTTSKYLFILPLVTLITQAIYEKKLIGWAALLGMAVTMLGLGVSEFDFKRKMKKQ